MLSPPTCYAVTALAHVVASGRSSVAVRDISGATGIPHAYLAKIVHRLARRGIVVTRRGIGGGIAAPPRRNLADVTLHEVCIALDDPVVETRCLLGQAECSEARACPAHRFWSPQRGRLVAFLQKTTLRDMARFERRQDRGRKDLR